MARPAALVFGPQTTLPSAELAFQLRAALLLDPRLYSLRACIETLPEIWPVLVALDLSLESVPGTQALQDLCRWLTHGEFPPVKEISELPAVIVTPFTVTLHIVQYMCYADPKNRGPTHEEVIQSVKDRGGIQGFCNGLLSAVAIATSPDVESVCSRAAVALKLAVAIGAYIDLDCLNSCTSSIAIRSRIATTENRLKDYLEDYPDTYISVVADASSSTVTGPTPFIDSLSQTLKTNGFSLKQVDLRGRFHYPGHTKEVETLRRLAASNRDFQLPHASELLAPVYSNINGQHLPPRLIHDTILESILMHCCDWYGSISAALSHINRDDEANVVQFGLVDCIPSSLLCKGQLSLHKITDVPGIMQKCHGTIPRTIGADGNSTLEPIAIIGMGCKFPGADSLEDFWQLLIQGTSMCRTMPEERFKTSGLRRSADNKLKFWGNFVNDIDAFDHRFFKKSSREASSMDPQQRLLMEVAYQALECAEYHGPSGSKAQRDIGCYIGLCETDYNDNVTSHQPNAFSSLGTLRAFITGKISHFFGWTGPSITYDTACSSSGVAIQAACRALQTGECSMALAGGVSLYTSPMFYQNLAAASFLSPTGPTKPFDAKGDGYCRGEGVGLVLLKPLSAALSDHDNIMAVITAAAVNQNENTTAITVPNFNSQTELYRKVVSESGLHPHDVTYVEAHGTGTPVGDPIEFSSIRTVFGGSNRVSPLAIASVKGNIGHTEGASGVASLIKTVLMMHHGVIPPQANHTQLNPKIAPLEEDNIVIPLASKAWTAKYKVACINNYGAAGSNAAMIVCEGPSASGKSLEQTPSLTRYPIYVSANSPWSLKAYSSKLLRLIPTNDSLPNLAFHLANRQNRSLPHALITSVTSQEELREHLTAIVEDRCTSIQQTSQAARPVVLVFGGQTSTSVGLCRKVYESSALLRGHLQQCDAILRSTGRKSIFPAVFQTESIPDVVQLHSALFSLQYACAMSWLDTGLNAAALVGHSFGQLTALAVSGVLSLKDGLALVTGRAHLMQHAWGSEPGSMISIQADIRTVTMAIEAVHGETPDDRLEVACFNGPTSHVVVGSANAIDRLQGLLTRESTRNKRLTVSHGFHSRFTEPLIPGLEQCAEGVKFREPMIPVETCSQGSSWTEFNASMIAQHTRTPVYFAEAVDRVSARLGPCTWLEAGSGSSVMGMARAALDRPSTHLFQAVQLGGDNATGALVDTTVNLWKAGHKVQFWPFHRSERASYSHLELPPYQFKRTQHWIDWIDNVTEDGGAVAISTKEQPSADLLTFIRYTGDRKQHAEFRVNPQHETYSFFVKGHAVLTEPLCPAGLYSDLACQAAESVSSCTNNTGSVPSVEDLEIQVPLGAGNRGIVLRLQQSSFSQSSWTFCFCSKDSNSPATDEQLHATGSVVLKPDQVKTAAELARFGRLISSSRYQEMMADPDSQVLQGPVVYQLFSKVVTYADYYKGVQSVYASGHEVTGRVRLPSMVKDPEFRRLLLLDNFIQTSGIHINCLSDTGSKEVYVCTKVDRIQPGSSFAEAAADKNTSWIVYSSSHPISGKEVVNDIFVFHAVSGELAVFILGAHFTRVLISSLVRVLSRANTADGAAEKAPHQPKPPVLRERPKAEAAAINVLSRLKDTLSPLIDVPVADINDGDLFGDLGVDSLLGTEVLNEINKAFNVSISTDEFALLTDIASIAKVLGTYLGVQDSLHDSDECQGLTDSGDSNHDTITGAVTPAFTTPDDQMVQLVDLVAGHLECEEAITPGSNLADLGLDSILSIELASDIKKMFNCEIDISQLDLDSTFADLVTLALPGLGQEVPSTRPISTMTIDLANAPQEFQQIRFDFDRYPNDAGVQGFWRRVYPSQARLVLAYTVEAFAQLGCNLAKMRPGDRLPAMEYLPQHQSLVSQLYNVLKDGMLIGTGDFGLVRSDKPVDSTHSSKLLEDLNAKAPHHSAEHRLLAITGSRLGDCLVGAADPLNLLLQSEINKHLLAGVYLNGPMFAATSRLLCRFLGNTFSNAPGSGTFQVLELGGGTGAATEHLLDYLVGCGIPFTYTFSDVSLPFVDAARERFSRRKYMRYEIIDVEKPPVDALIGKFHAVISANGIHATKNLEVSTRNIHKMLLPDGFTALVQFTRNMYCFDLIFGPFDGWWQLEDGRTHIIASQTFWDMSMRKAGFQHVSWTDGETLEARTLRIIAGFKRPALDESLSPTKESRDTESAVETVLYKQTDTTPLFADIYYPPWVSDTPRPIALMIHGGGHVMLSRKDIRPKQTAYLHSLGFLPVSIDYRLCPETTLPEGPMRDVSDALIWARTTLPSLPLLCPGLKVDPSRLVVVGWSTGGTLAMTTAFTSIERGLAPPNAILAFYCPTDYEDPFWARPNYPENTDGLSLSKYNLLEGVRTHPITAYNVPSAVKAVGGWMAPEDPRSRIVLHMNWKGQCLPVLLRGLPTVDSVSPSELSALMSQPQPEVEEIQRVSPYAQIQKGVYRTPTFVIHGTDDDLIPWSQSVRTVEALKGKGIRAEVIVPQGKVHLFDLYRDVDGSTWETVQRGYDFLSEVVFGKM
ncbi:hypothetical protein BDW59DRAFT_167452 [Aspergillus cavernicola]|uniref:Polyketide synthase n=1 Tax=Aspergillus cavernicola TaxID=176166 RepID=A0ABR4HEP5_9EURO